MSQTTKVFVHVVPETSAVWSPIVDELSTRGVTNIVLLSPPGFGTPSPAGWGATMYDYRDWLINELDNIDGPIDLVAHDWGAGHTYSALAARPNIVRSWATDVIGCLQPDYIWHEAALRCQTPRRCAPPTVPINIVPGVLPAWRQNLCALSLAGVPCSPPPASGQPAPHETPVPAAPAPPPHPACTNANARVRSPSWMVVFLESSDSLACTQRAEDLPS